MVTKNGMGEGIRVLHDDDPGYTDLAATFLERESERFEVYNAGETINP